jgi:hypothetical protein
MTDPDDPAPRSLPEPEVRVYLECPDCGYQWNAATILPDAWWGKGVTPQKIAAICWCPKCCSTPPTVVDMRPV